MKSNTTNVAPILALFITVFFSFVMTSMSISAEASPTQFKVGETAGWQQPEENHTALYSEWAAKNRFVVGDSLYFEYKNDSVLVVDKGGYYHCNTTNPIFVFNNGKTVVKLEKPGPCYFISGAPEHCKHGQRLNVNVMAVHHSPPSPVPPSIAVPPTTMLSPAPSPDHPNTSSGSLISAPAASILVCSLAVGLLMMLLSIGAAP